VRLRDVVIFFAGVFIGALIQLFRDKPPAVWKRLNPIGKVYRRPGYKDIAFLGWHGEEDPFLKAKREYPPLHAGGPTTNDIYIWAANQVAERSIDKAQAWDEAIIEYPDLIAPEGKRLDELGINDRRRAFMEGVGRILRAHKSRGK